MSALSSINAVVGRVFDLYGEDATYSHKGGGDVFLKFVRFDPYQRQDIVGDSLASTDPSVWVLLEDIPNPEVNDTILVGSDEYKVRDIELHKLRGYARLHVRE